MPRYFTFDGPIFVIPGFALLPRSSSAAHLPKIATNRLISVLLAFQKWKNVYNPRSVNELPIEILVFTITGSDKERGRIERP
jgi:hypothetical protein